MFDMYLENKDGKTLQFGASTPYTITEFSGLNPPKATINTSTTATLDGGMFNSAKLQMRSINLAFAIEENAEQNRLAVYEVVQPKNPINLYYQSEMLDVFISGYVEEVSPSYFAKKQVVTVSILCPFPYFKSAQQVVNELSSVIKKFHFPFASEGGKNLLQITENTQTVGGVTFTVNDDGSITADGTASDYTWSAYVTQSLVLDAGTYILNGCPSGGSSTTYRLQAFTGNPSNPTLTANDYGSGATFTLSEQSTVFVRMLVKGTVDNLTFNPMVRYSVYTNGDFQPFGYGQIVFGVIDPLTSVIIVNQGSVQTGLTFELYAKNPITNPKIFNYQTGEFLAINTTMQQGDLITITTGQGNKTITLLRDGVTTNIFNLLDKNSTWLQLDIGGGVFVYEVGEGSTVNLSVTISHYDLFEGV